MFIQFLSLVFLCNQLVLQTLHFAVIDKGDTPLPPLSFPLPLPVYLSLSLSHASLLPSSLLSFHKFSFHVVTKNYEKYQKMPKQLKVKS